MPLVNSSFQIWMFVASQAALGMAAGEVSIRYFMWYSILLKSKTKYTAAPLILGIAIILGFLSSLYLQFMVSRVSYSPRLFIQIPEGFVFAEITRIGLFAGICFLTYPVSKIHYQQAWGRAVIELLVRCFLVVTAFIAGLECSAIYHCVIRHAC